MNVVDILRCIGCGTPLSEALQIEHMHAIECATCRARYGMVVLWEADAEEWAWIAEARLFCRLCGGPHDIVIQRGPEGRVMVCPRHGPASAWIESRSDG